MQWHSGPLKMAGLVGTSAAVRAILNLSDAQSHPVFRSAGGRAEEIYQFLPACRFFLRAGRSFGFRCADKAAPHPIATRRWRARDTAMVLA